MYNKQDIYQEKKRIRTDNRNIISKIFLTDTSELSFFKRALYSCLTYIISLLRKFSSDRCLEKAGALAFAALLAIFPIIAVILFLIPVFYSDVEQAQILQGYIKDFITSKLFPVKDYELSQSLVKYFDSFTAYSTKLGIISLLTLILVSIFLFITVEKSINEIWRVTDKRSYLRRIFIFSGFIIWVPLLIGLSFFISSYFIRRIEYVGKLTPIFFPFLLTAFVLIIGNYFIPYTHVKLRYAFLGGAISGILWEIAKYYYGLYISISPIFKSFVHTLGAIPIFLLWIYCTWLIILLGVEITYISQKRRMVLRENISKFQYSHKIDIGSTILTVLTIAENFNSGKGEINIEDIARKTHISKGELDRIIEYLEANELIKKLSDEEAYIIARPLEQLKLSSIIKDINYKSLNAALIDTKFSAEKTNSRDLTISEILNHK